MRVNAEGHREPREGEAEIAPRDLLEVRQFSEKYPPFRQSKLRNYILNATDRFSADGSIVPGNGLDECGAIYRIGRRLYLSESRFFEWIGSQQQKKVTKNA